jgi:LCP family protein required for cell wall assembly
VPATGPDAPRTGTPRSAANADGLLALGDAIERRQTGDPRRRSRRNRRRWVRWTALGAGALVALVVLALVADYIYLGTLVSHTQVNGEQTIGPSADENILLVGSTTRCAKGEVQSATTGFCSQATGVNSDIVMVVHLDPNNHKVSLLSIPRDLFEPNARESAQANKIDAALYQGPSQLAYAVEEDFGIPINHFVELNFTTFANVVDAIGGIDMYFPMKIFDAYSSLNIERPGCYHLDGLHALEVVRARHLQVDLHPAVDGTDPRNWWQEPESDLARIRRTHEFLRVVAAKVATMGVGNPIQDQNLATTLLPDLTVDQSFNEGEMVSLADTYHSTSISSVPQFTYPVVLNYGAGAQASYDYFYKGGNYGDVEFPVQPGGWQTVDSIFGVQPGFSSWNGKPLPHAGAFHVSVVNGTGIYNQQATIATQLTHEGFDAAPAGTRAPVGTTSETVVWYGGPKPPPNNDWKSASLEAALRVMSQIEGPATLGYNPAMVTTGDMVTVQTGSDIFISPKNLTAPPTTTSTSTPSSTTTTVRSTGSTTTTVRVTTSTVPDPPGLSNDNNFSHPSDTAQPLAPWDPRACTPKQLNTIINR